MNLAKLVKPYRIDKAKSFRLKEVDPADTRAAVGLALSAALNAPVTRGPAPVYRM